MMIATHQPKKEAFTRCSTQKMLKAVFSGDRLITVIEILSPLYRLRNSFVAT